MSEMKITGIDLAKTNFYLFSIDAYGKPAGKIKLPAQHVRAYQRRQKNDYNDAQAIAEACQHGTIRPVM